MMYQQLLSRKQFMLAPAFKDERERERAERIHAEQESGRKSLEEFFSENKEFFENPLTSR